MSDKVHYSLSCLANVNQSVAFFRTNGNINSTKNIITTGATMHTEKLSISLPKEQYLFLEDYQSKHHYKSRSEVVSKALHLLQQIQLEAYYKEANQEIDSDFETTTLDGLDEHETW